ncbi:hypothetical protein SBOR_0369 [Sclerotinia borealis F-4128]|uniref:Uncharacterized protein n=1 Tax=Sclerotinia borealis (strain F-4128) TaxID=1432307 RepID=W9CTK9_SCLBF|nr:hypothetical protein SBOR_0369 [Sclerotinia borealis F-4128]
MGGLCSRLDTNQVEIFRRSVADLVYVIQQQDVILAQLIETVTQLNNEEISQLQLEKILQHIDPPKACSNPTSPQNRKSKHLSRFISNFQEQQADTQAFIEKKCSEWRENHSLFWKDASCSTSLTSASIRQLSRCIDEFEDAKNLNPIRRRISLVVFFRLEEQIRKRIRSLIIDTERKLPSGCSSNEYKVIRAYLATMPYSQSYSALVVDLKKAFIGAESIEDVQLDAIIESGKFRLDQYDQSVITILSGSNIDSHHLQSRKRQCVEYNIQNYINNNANYTESPRDRVPGIIPINALLNQADCIAGSTQGQQLLSVGNSSIQIASEQPEIGSRGEKRGLESQAEVYDPSSKHRRIDTLPSHGSSLTEEFDSPQPPQAPSEVTHDQEGVTGSPPLGNANTSTIFQAEEYQDFGTLEIDFTYSYAQKEKLAANLREPFLSPVIAGYHPECIHAMVPSDVHEDVRISIIVDDNKATREVIRILDLQKQPQGHSPDQIQLYSNIPKNKIWILGDSLNERLTLSQRYKLELGPRSTCVSAFISDGGGTDDGKITFFSNDGSEIKFRIDHFWTTDDDSMSLKHNLSLLVACWDIPSYEIKLFLNYRHDANKWMIETVANIY